MMHDDPFEDNGTGRKGTHRKKKKKKKKGGTEGGRK